MKSIHRYVAGLIAGGALLASAILCCSFDWPVQSNDSLRKEMLSYATSFLNDCQGQKAAKPLRRFLKRQQREANPYAWIEATHNVVNELKRMYPPSLGNRNIRSGMLQLLDYPLHINNTAPDATPEELDAYYRSTRQYLNSARRTVLDQLEKAGTSETKVWKVYNSGFVIRRNQINMGIDISDRPAMSKGYATWTASDYERFARCLDVLFMTHPHDDHYALPLIKAMIAAGKPVVMPWPLTVPENHPYADTISQITSLPGADTLLHVLDHEQTTPVRIAGINIASYPGNQGQGIPCNVYWMDLDGFRVIHNGDNYDRKAEAMLSTLPAAHLILGASWNDMQELLAEAMKAPGAESISQVFVPAHENELGHGVSHRESYRELFTRPDRLNNPDFRYPAILLLDCGEAFTVEGK